MFPINSASGQPVSVSPLFNPVIAQHKPPEPELESFTVQTDRGLCATDASMRSLLQNASKIDDLTESIGTVLEGVQLSTLTDQQKDELALLVSTRGVVFLRDQTMTTSEQVEFSRYLGVLDRHPAQRDQEYITILGATRDFRSEAAYTPWPQGEYHSDTSYEVNRTSLCSP